MKNYYDILGVNEEAQENVIKQRFREMAKRYHPDRNADPEAHQLFIEISEAYETLIDPQKRVLYKYRLQRWQNRTTRPPEDSYTPAYEPAYPPRHRAEYHATVPREDPIHPAIYHTARIARILAVCTLLFGLVLVVDFFWQRQLDDQVVESNELIPPSTLRSTWTLIIQLPGTAFPMSPFLKESLQVGDTISIRQSYLFGVVTRVGIPRPNQPPHWFRPHVGIYGPPFVMVILMICLSVATWRKTKQPMIPTLLGILLIFLGIITLGILHNSYI